jgi:hypothetical protein
MEIKILVISLSIKAKPAFAGRQVEKPNLNGASPLKFNLSADRQVKVLQLVNKK